MKSYLELLEDVLENGTEKGDRTGTGTTSVFGRQIRHDLSKGFPLLTTKKLHFKSIANELIWFLNGDTNNNWLNENGVKIWNEWAAEDGDLGPIYGKQWTAWPTKDGETINQIDYVVETLKICETQGHISLTEKMCACVLHSNDGLRICRSYIVLELRETPGSWQALDIVGLFDCHGDTMKWAKRPARCNR